LYRPFDIRYLYYDAHLIARPTTKIVRHVEPNNPMLIVGRAGSAVAGIWSLAFVSNTAVDWNVFYRGGGTTFPLWLKPDGALASQGVIPNFATTFLASFAANLGLNIGRGDDSSFGASDIFNYIYALLYSPAYRTRYSESLKRDFPRVLMITDQVLFRQLARLGANLVSLHLGSNTHRSIGSAGVTYRGSPTPEVDSGYPKFDDGRVLVGGSSWFEKVNHDMWSFVIGGYQICNKWLKDRRGRVLTDKEIGQYKNILIALRDTLRIGSEIDKLVDAHGGWPDAFLSDKNAATDAAVTPRK
jgi:hypothetical protein